MKLETEYIPIEQLNAWDKNPRLHNLDSIIESIKEFGFRDPISINENNSEIEEGHGRLKALKKLKEAGSEPPAFIIQQNGTWLVPVQRFNDTELNQKRYSLAHNRTQELGGYDEPLLLENLIDLKEDLFATGYTSEDIDLLNEKLDGGYKHSEKDDRVPEVQKIAITKPGELWLLGRHRLLCGDATKKEDVERLMDGQKADMVFTDPPYGIKYQGHSVKTQKITGDDKKISNYLLSIEYVKNADSELYFCCDFKSYPVLYFAIMEYDREIKELITWDKTEGKDMVQVPQGALDLWIRSTEFIAYSGKLKQNYGYSANIFHLARIYGKNTLNEQDNFIKDHDGKISEIHPTIKPLVIIERCINAHPHNKIVLDLFLGSGSTLIACEKTNRICYGMEIEPLYIDVIIRRWQDFTGLEATREDGVKFNELI